MNNDEIAAKKKYQNLKTKNIFHSKKKNYSEYFRLENKANMKREQIINS